MSQRSPAPTDATGPDVSIDIESVVRRVLRQARETGQAVETVPPVSSVVIDQPVFSLQDVRAIGDGMTSIVLASRTVLAPAAHDESRDRGIAVEKTNTGRKSSPTNRRSIASRTRAIKLLRDGDVAQELYSSVQKQVGTRGIRLCDRASVTVIVSGRPAVTAHSQVGPGRCVVSIHRVDDVPRFPRELSPNVFVLDVVHLHLVTISTQTQ